MFPSLRLPREILIFINCYLSEPVTVAIMIPSTVIVRSVPARVDIFPEAVCGIVPLIIIIASICYDAPKQPFEGGRIVCVDIVGV
jgi:hypothetical protein